MLCFVVSVDCVMYQSLSLAICMFVCVLFVCLFVCFACCCLLIVCLFFACVSHLLFVC